MFISNFLLILWFWSSETERSKYHDTHLGPYRCDVDQQKSLWKQCNDVMCVCVYVRAHGCCSFNDINCVLLFSVYSTDEQSTATHTHSYALTMESDSDRVTSPPAGQTRNNIHNSSTCTLLTLYSLYKHSILTVNSLCPSAVRILKGALKSSIQQKAANACPQKSPQYTGWHHGLICIFITSSWSFLYQNMFQKQGRFLNEHRVK